MKGQLGSNRAHLGEKGGAINSVLYGSRRTCCLLTKLHDEVRSDYVLDSFCCCCKVPATTSTRGR